MNLARVFPFRRKVDRPRLRLLCLPYAGGGASLYRQWSPALEPAVEVCPVELPGRGVRGDESLVPDMTSLCDGLAAAVEELADGVPMALFGHSMGARIAFELARRFEGQVVHLFASASAAPGAPWKHAAGGDVRPTIQLTDDEFRQRLRALGGTPLAILDDDDLMARVMPIVRADFVLIEGYRAAPRSCVGCPVTAFAGVDDPRASPSDAAAWELSTTAAFRLVELDAGHFFVDSHRSDLLREIRRDLAVL